MFELSMLWRAPEVNPVNRKARSIPLLNPINVYGRVFFFGWFGFFVAFWSWYAFPPLLGVTIKGDLNLSTTDIANSNIVSLCATLLVRVISGPMCDLIGARYTFALTLFIGSIPTALAGTAHDAGSLMAIRFFVGILGGSFVPCQVWSTGFFDKNVVGTSNAIAAGLGNAGGGVTYFVMTSIYDSLLSHGLAPRIAWRVDFIVPFIIINATALGLLLLCPDTPTGKWNERHLHAQQSLQAHGVSANIVDVPGGITDKKSEGSNTPTSAADNKALGEEAGISAAKHTDFDHEHKMAEAEMLATAQGEVVQKPTWQDAAKVALSPQTLALGAAYFTTFGCELAVNSVLGNYYLKNFPALGQTGTGNWAAMFGLLNVVTRPLGGIGSDLVYAKTKSLWLKKAFIHICGIIGGMTMIIIGQLDPHNQNTMFGLIALLAIFIEAGNGCTFALVPHVHPTNNGIISGFVGAIGNMGGIIFAIVFRYSVSGATTYYNRAFWIIGIIMIVLHSAVAWIPPIPKGQIGGR